MTLQNTLDELKSFSKHGNEHIANYAQTVINYSDALKTGKISLNEYESLLGDIEKLKRMAQTAEEQDQVVKIHDLSRLLLSFLF